MKTLLLNLTENKLRTKSNKNNDKSLIKILILKSCYNNITIFTIII